MRVGFGSSRLLLYLSLAVLPFATSCGGFRIVGGGGAWRSPQPTLADLEFAAKELGVRTVISLRAEKPGAEWFEREKRTCERLGLHFVSLGWSARNVPDAAVDKLVEAFEQLPGPYLLHCGSGKDRVSLASAIYRMVVLGHDADDAGEEIGFVPYGHLPILGYEAIDEAWERFRSRYAAGKWP